MFPAVTQSCSFIGNKNRFYICVQFVKCTGNQRVYAKIIPKRQHIQAISSRSLCTDEIVTPLKSILSLDFCLSLYTMSLLFARLNLPL